MLTDTEITDALRKLPGWSRQDKRLQKEFTFATFPDAIAFLVRVAFDAESTDHHPDVFIHYRRLTLSFWTHSEGGITKNDVEGAKRAQDLAEQSGVS